MKYEVLKTFRDKNTKEIYAVGSIADLTAKRAKEVEKKLGSGFIKKKD